MRDRRALRPWTYGLWNWRLRGPERARPSAAPRRIPHRHRPRPTLSPGRWRISPSARRCSRAPTCWPPRSPKRRHPVQQIIGTLLQVEIADKQARSIKYQMASAKLPTAKELADFDFAASPVNEPLIQELPGGGFLEGQRNIVLVGGTGTGKTHLAVAIARSCIRT